MQAMLRHAAPAVPAVQVRGPHTVRKYFNSDAAAADGEGWFDTGDVATIDPLGHMQVGISNSAAMFRPARGAVVDEHEAPQSPCQPPSYGL